ncbi:hypothetical protein Tco_0405378, partial [Tanacetum coccineum]
RRRDAWNSRNKDGSRTGKKEDSKALVTIDGEGVDWTNHSEEDKDYALMACNSSDSDTEVISCSNKESYANLKKLYDAQREQLSDASIEIKAYSQGLKQGCQDRDPTWDRFCLCKIEIIRSDRDRDKTDVLTYHKKLLAEAQKEKGLKAFKVEKWAIIFFSRIFAEPSELVSEPVVNESNVECQPKVWSDAPIIEEYESDSEHEYVFFIPTKQQETPSFANQQEFNHLLEDCDIHGKRDMARKADLNNGWNNVQRVNKKNQFVPSAVLTRTGLSTIELLDKGIVDSGCSRHMTGNKAYLAEFQDFNGGPVAFGGSKGYITGKGKIKWTLMSLLKVLCRIINIDDLSFPSQSLKSILDDARFESIVVVFDECVQVEYGVKCRLEQNECGSVVEFSSANVVGEGVEFMEVLLTNCVENEFFKDFQDTSESSDDNTNVVNAPREPIVVNQDPSENSSPSPPHIDHCCHECGDSLDGIFCRTKCNVDDLASQLEFVLEWIQSQLKPKTRETPLRDKFEDGASLKCHTEDPDNETHVIMPRGSHKPFKVEARIDIPSYDGTIDAEKLDTWIDQLETYFTLYGLSSTEKRRKLRGMISNEIYTKKFIRWDIQKTDGHGGIIFDNNAGNPFKSTLPNFDVLPVMLGISLTYEDVFTKYVVVLQ